MYFLHLPFSHQGLDIYVEELDLNFQKNSFVRTLSLTQ